MSVIIARHTEICAPSRMPIKSAAIPSGALTNISRATHKAISHSPPMTVNQAPGVKDVRVPAR